MYDWDRIEKILNISLSYEGDWTREISYVQKAIAFFAQQPIEQPAKKCLPSHVNIYGLLLISKTDIQSFVEVFRYLKKHPSASHHFGRHLDNVFKPNLADENRLIQVNALLFRVAIRLYIIYYDTKNPSILNMVKAVLEKSTSLIDSAQIYYTCTFMAKFMDFAVKIKIFDDYKTFVVNTLQTLQQNKKTKTKFGNPSPWYLDDDYIKNPAYQLIHELLFTFIKRHKYGTDTLPHFLDIIALFIIKIFKKNKYERINADLSNLKYSINKYYYLGSRMDIIEKKLGTFTTAEESPQELQALSKKLRSVKLKRKMMRESILLLHCELATLCEDLTSLLSIFHEKHYFFCQKKEKTIFESIKKINDELRLESYVIKGRVPPYLQKGQSCWLAAAYRLDAYWGNYQPTDERRFIDQLHVSKKSRQYLVGEWEKEGGPNYFTRDKFFRSLSLQPLMSDNTTGPSPVPFVPLTPKDLMEHIKIYGPLYAPGPFVSANPHTMKLREARRQGQNFHHVLCVIGVVSSWFVVVVDSNDIMYREKIIPFHDFAKFLSAYGLQYHRDALKRYNDNKA